MEPQKGPYQDRRPFETGDVGFQGEDMCLMQGCIRVHAVLALGLERVGHEVLARGMREYDHLPLKTPPQNQSFRYVVYYNIQGTSNIMGWGVFILADGNTGRHEEYGVSGVMTWFAQLSCTGIRALGFNYLRLARNAEMHPIAGPS